MTSALRRSLLWLPALAWATTLFYLSSRPAGPEPGPWFLANDKLDHAVAYGLLSALLFIPLRYGARRSATRAALGALLIASLYGITDEFHQRFVPTRVPDVLDWLADTAGAAAAAWLALAVTRRLPNQSGQPQDCSVRPAG